MNLFEELTSISNEHNVKVIQSFDSKECNEYEFFDTNNRKICYVIEYFNNPITNELLKKPFYEIYYNNSNDTNNYDDDDFCSSDEYDNVENLENILIAVLSES